MKAYHAITAISSNPRPVMTWLRKAETLPIDEITDDDEYESLSIIISKWLLDLTESKARDD